MTIKVAGRTEPAKAQSLAQELQAKLNDGHLDVKEVQQLKRGWSNRPVTFEQAREFRQAVLGSATRIQPEARKELQAFIETQLPVLTAKPDGGAVEPRNVWEELQLKSLGQGRIDHQSTRELISSWSQKPMTADEAQNMTAQLLSMTGTFGSKEARLEVQCFLQEKLPGLISDPDKRVPNFDTDLRLAAMDDGHLDARDVQGLVKKWSGTPLNQDQARWLSEAVARSGSSIDPGEARKAMQQFLDQQLPGMVKLQAPDVGPAPQGFREALEAKIQPDGHLDSKELSGLLREFGSRPVTQQQANELRQTVLNNASNIQPGPRAQLQRFLETQLPTLIARETGQQPPTRVPADELRLKALGTGTIDTAQAQSLVDEWGKKPVSADEARAMTAAFLANTGAFGSRPAIQVMQKFLLERLPGVTEGQTPRDLGFELKVAMADDGKLNAGEAKQLVGAWSKLSLTDGQRLQLAQMVEWQKAKIDPGEACQSIQAFVDSELAKRVVTPPAQRPGVHAVNMSMQSAHANRAPEGTRPTMPFSPNPEGPATAPQSLADALRLGVRNDGHLDLDEVSAVLKAWGEKPVTAGQAAELRGNILSEASRIQPDAREALQRYLENELPRLTAADPNVPGPSFGQQLELKALGDGSVSTADARALVQEWSKGPLTAQQAQELTQTVAWQSNRFTSNAGLRTMQAFVQQKLPTLVKDPQNLGRDFNTELRVALLDDGRLDQTKVDRLIAGWKSGPKLTAQQANELRSVVAQNLRWVDGEPAKLELTRFAERDLPGLTAPVKLDAPRSTREPQSLQEALLSGAGGRMEDGPHLGRLAIEPEQVQKWLGQFKGSVLTASQARELKNTVLNLGPQLDPASRQALQHYLEKELPGRVATEPGAAAPPLDPYSELRLKAFGSGSISEAGANELVRSWSGQRFTASEAQQVRQALISSAGSFENNAAIATVQRFALGELPKRVSDRENLAPAFADDLRLATLVDGKIDSKAAGRLIDGWKRSAPLDAGRANELVQGVIDNSAALDAASAAQLQGFITRDLPKLVKEPKGFTLDFTQSLRAATLGTGKLDAEGAQKLIAGWSRQTFSPQQATALTDAVLGHRDLLKGGQTREVLRRFLEVELPKRTTPGADGVAEPRSPKQMVALMELDDGRIDSREARRLVAVWNDPRTTPGHAEAIRQAIANPAFDGKAQAIVSRFVNVNLPRLTLGQALTAPNTAELSWTPPFANQDGSLLTNLLGYEIDVGTAPGQITETFRVTDPAATSFDVPNRTSGTWYFRARTIAGPDVARQQTSVPSNEVSKVIK